MTIFFPIRVNFSFYHSAVHCESCLLTIVVNPIHGIFREINVFIMRTRSFWTGLTKLHIHFIFNWKPPSKLGCSICLHLQEYIFNWITLAYFIYNAAVSDNVANFPSGTFIRNCILTFEDISKPFIPSISKQTKKSNSHD